MAMIDPSIFHVQPLQQNDPLESYAKVMAIRGAMDRQKLTGLQIQQEQQGIADDQASRNLPADAPDDQLFHTLGATKALAVIKARHEAQKTKFESDDKQLEIAGKRTKRLGELANGINDTESQHSFALTAMQEKLIEPEQAIKLLLSPYDPNAVERFRQQALSVDQATTQKREEEKLKMARAEEAHNVIMRPLQEQAAKTDAATKDVDLETKNRQNTAAKLGAATTKDAYARIWYGMDPKEAAAFTHPDQFDPKTTPNQVRQLGMTAEQQVTAQQGERRVVLSEKELTEHIRHNRQLEEGVTLSPEAIDKAADMFATTGQMISLGMGASAAKMRAQIIQRAATKYKDVDWASNAAAYQANKSSLTQLQKSFDSVTAFESTANKNLDLLLAAGQKIVDSGSPWINAPLRSVSKNGIGSTDMAAYEAARQVALTEIAKVTSNPNLTGQLSDSARKEVMGFNPTSATFKQTLAVAKVLKQDMANRKQSMSEQITAIKGRIGVDQGKSTTSPGQPSSGSPAAPQPGDVVDGYVFRGGNPADKNNWKAK